MLPRPPVLEPIRTFQALGHHPEAPRAAEVAVRARHPVVKVCVAPGVAPDAGHQRVRRILGWRRRGESFELPSKLFPW